ncbi:hypothetical protein ACQPXM_13120 [Kribbella sp. CA-253562]|uniref:hypothetical protein n=1 Tax=Kribbella sp. CA-253562 TaxID=3239942 RepID=UPI003D906239
MSVVKENSPRLTRRQLRGGWVILLGSALCATVGLVAGDYSTSTILLFVSIYGLVAMGAVASYAALLELIKR